MAGDGVDLATRVRLMFTTPTAGGHTWPAPTTSVESGPRTVFVSYSRDDLSLATTVVETLERAGLSVWWDGCIAAGADFDRSIDDALHQAACVLVLWTARSVQSRWVRNEARVALESGKLLSVLVGSDVRRPTEFAAVQGLDFRGGGTRLDAAERQAIVDGVHAMLTRAPLDTASTRPRRRWRRLLGVTLLVAGVAAGGIVGSVRLRHHGEPLVALALGEQPYDIAVTDTVVWVTDWTTGLLWRRNRATGASVSVSVPGALELARDDTGEVAVSSSVERSTVVLVNGDLALRRVETGATVDDMALDATTLWVAQHDAGRVTAVDTATGERRWSTPVDGVLSIVADDGALWASAEADGAGRVLRLDPVTGEILGTTPAGLRPVGLTALDGIIWVADERRGTVDAYDGSLRPVVSVPAGAGLLDLATDGRRIWATSAASSEIVAIDARSHRVVHRRQAPGQPFKIDGTNDLIAATSPRGGSVLLLPT